MRPVCAWTLVRITMFRLLWRSEDTDEASGEEISEPVGGPRAPPAVVPGPFVPAPAPLGTAAAVSAPPPAGVSAGRPCASASSSPTRQLGAPSIR